MLSAWDFSLKLDVPLVINWPQRAYAYGQVSEEYRFFDLFDKDSFLSRSDSVSISFDPHDVILERYAHNKGIKVTKFRGHPRQFFLESEFLLFTQTSSLNFGCPDSRLNNSLHHHAIFKSIKFNKKIQKCLDDISQDHSIQTATSVHIRRGDIIPLLENCGIGLDGKAYLTAVSQATRLFSRRYAPTSAYSGAIATLSPHQKLLIFSDDDAIQLQMSSAHPHQTINFLDVVEKNQLSQSQKAFFELILMSRSNQIISSDSGFSGIAAFLGQIKRSSILSYINPDELARDITSFIGHRSDRRQIFYYLIDAYKKDLPKIIDRKSDIIISLYECERASLEHRMPELLSSTADLRADFEAQRRKVAALAAKLKAANRKVWSLRKKLDGAQKRLRVLQASHAPHTLTVPSLPQKEKRLNQTALSARWRQIWQRITRRR